MKMCINWKVVGALALVGLAVFAAAPNLIGAALPLLVLAACPLSMLVMMRAMSGGSRCRTGAEATAGEVRSDAGPTSAELARLRAEVERLRAEQAGQHDGADGTRSTA